MYARRQSSERRGKEALWGMFVCVVWDGRSPGCLAGGGRTEFRAVISRRAPCLGCVGPAGGRTASTPRRAARLLDAGCTGAKASPSGWRGTASLSVRTTALPFSCSSSLNKAPGVSEAVSDPACVQARQEATGPESGSTSPLSAGSPLFDTTPHTGTLTLTARSTKRSWRRRGLALHAQVSVKPVSFSGETGPPRLRRLYSNSSSSS